MNRASVIALIVAGVGMLGLWSLTKRRPTPAKPLFISAADASSTVVSAGFLSDPNRTAVAPPARDEAALHDDYRRMEESTPPGPKRQQKRRRFHRNN
jgi:hypothetical protein